MIHLKSHKTVQSADRRPITFESSDDRPTHWPMKRGIFRYDIGRLIGRSSADHRPIAKTQKLSADGKNYNKVVIILFLAADGKRA